ncbi:MAG: VCBS repeat-containing protein [Candidatus Omnitrophica bacterium]|nr:VCBS repeat-containing protein [Candidatus Omnitrophota bacterium]
MRRHFRFLYIGLLVCCICQISYSQIYGTGSFNGPVSIPDSQNGRRIPIAINTSGPIAEVTVSIDVEHPKPNDLKIELRHNNITVILFDGRQMSLPAGSTGIQATYDYPDHPVTTLRVFNGMEAYGMWDLVILDNNEDGVEGKLNSCLLEIELIQYAEKVITDNGRSFSLRVDGYGSFGDFNGGNLFGADYRVSDETVGKTVYASALFLHSSIDSENRYLTSMDFFPGERLPSIPVVEIQEDVWESRFTIGTLQCSLIQQIIKDPRENNTFWLLQDYELIRSIDAPLIVSRLFYPKFRFTAGSQADNINYFYPKLWDFLKPPELFIFDEIRDLEESFLTPFLNISYRTKGGYWQDSFVDDWRPSGKSSLQERLLDEGLELYEGELDPTDWRDYDGDLFTDPGYGFDAALSMGVTLPFDKDKQVMHYAALTQWGYSSPMDIARATDEFDYYPYDFPTRTPTATPTPTNTPTPPTPTNTPIPPEWIKPLPDIRIIADQEKETPTPNILDFKEYIYDPDTPLENMEFSWDIKGPYSLIIDENNRYLSASSNERSSYIEEVEIFVQDRTAKNFIKDTLKVKISSFLTESFRPVPPIVLNAGENEFKSPYKLNDFIHDFDSFPEDSFEWFVYGPLPKGVENVIIHEDTSFTLITNSDFGDQLINLPFVVRRLPVPGTPTLPPTATETPIPPTSTNTLTPTATQTPIPPTPTNTPTPTATQTPIPPTPTNTLTPTTTQTPIPPTPTNTFTPTATQTPIPPTPTNTFTPTATQTPIPPTPTNTLTPTATQTPIPPTPTYPASATPTPSKPTATPTPRCSDAFAFPEIASSGMRMGPVDWIELPGAERGQRIAVAHYDEGLIGFYTRREDRYVLDSQIETQLGVANVIAGDFNGDATPDLFVMNAAQESLTVYTAQENGGFKEGPSLDLMTERIPDIYNIENGFRYQSLAVGRIDDDDADDAVVRAIDSVLVVLSKNNQLRVEQRIELSGVTRFIKGHDFDQDGDLDFILAVRSLTGEEQIQVYQNERGVFSRIQTLRTDLSLQGNNPNEAVLLDWNEDGIMDLIVLVFSGEVQRYKGNGDGTFTRAYETSPFPLGEMVGFDVVDLDGDGRLDLVGLHRSQNGLSLMAGCGEEKIDLASFPISAAAPSGEIYVLRCIDVDNDGDPDILFTRSILDDLIWMENESERPANP